MHCGRLECVLCLLDDLAGVIRNRDDAVPSGKTDPPGASLAGFGYRVVGSIRISFTVAGAISSR
jgi:hypothetical protein